MQGSAHPNQALSERTDMEAVQYLCAFFTAGLSTAIQEEHALLSFDVQASSFGRIVLNQPGLSNPNGC